MPIREIFVKNISFSSTPESLADAISEELEAHHDNGQRCRCSIVKLPVDRESGRLRGFAFITLQTGKLSMPETVDALFGLRVDGRPIHVEEIQPRRGEA